MATWNSKWTIGNGEKTTQEAASPVYRDYDVDCEMPLNKELFDEIKQRFNIYFATQLLKNIQFKPRDQVTQHTINYYFGRLDVKFPRQN